MSGVVYRFTRGRAADQIASQLDDFKGCLVGDGYSGNQAAANLVEEEIVLAGCWAHCTRKFRDALCEVPGSARLFQLDIKQLYAVEKEADQADLDPAARLQLRQRKSRGVLARILARARRLSDEFSDAGKMAKAMGYLLNQRKPLRRFLEDGRIPLDNNIGEAALKRAILHRKNSLFYRSQRGARVGDLFMSLISTCQFSKTNPFDYLTELQKHVEKAAADPQAWMPWNYQEACQDRAT